MSKAKVIRAALETNGCDVSFEFVKKLLFPMEITAQQVTNERAKLRKQFITMTFKSRDLVKIKKLLENPVVQEFVRLANHSEEMLGYQDEKEKLGLELPSGE